MPESMFRTLSCLLFALLVFAGDGPFTNQTETPGQSEGGSIHERDTAVAAMHSVRTLVGEWKGVAQPKRGSNAGAWSLTAEGAWDFSGPQAELVLKFQPGRPYESLHFTVDPEDAAMRLQLKSESGEPISLVCQSTENTNEQNDGTLIFETTSEAVPGVRCTLRMISEIRLALLFEERATGKGGFRRVVECGLTRSGARLASGNTGERQCIVTGGLGTIAVKHADKTYYVCCEGCRQAFEADPEGTLKAYRARLKAQQDEPSVPKK